MNFPPIWGAKKASWKGLQNGLLAHFLFEPPGAVVGAAIRRPWDPLQREKCRGRRPRRPAPNAIPPAVGSTRTYNYDVLQRLSSVTGGVYGKTYTYRDTSTTNTTTQVAGLTYDLPTDITYGYTYDVLGNIATYTQGGTTYTYTYDAQNQLLKQVGGGKTYTYT